MPAEHLLLELQQLDHQAGKGFVGGGLGLDVLRNTRRVKVDTCVFDLMREIAFTIIFISTFIDKRVIN